MSEHYVAQVTLNTSFEVPEGTNPEYALEDVVEHIWKLVPQELSEDYLRRDDRLEHVSFVDAWKDLVVDIPPYLVYTPETVDAEEAIIGYLKACGYEGRYLHGPDQFMISRRGKAADPISEAPPHEDPVRTTDLDAAIDYIRYAILPQ